MKRLLHSVMKLYKSIKGRANCKRYSNLKKKKEKKEENMTKK